MRLIFVFLISLFFSFSGFSQNKNGIIYDYKKTQLTFTLGTKTFLEAGYLYRITKNIGIGGSISHHRNLVREAGYIWQGEYGAGGYDYFGNFIGYAGYEYVWNGSTYELEYTGYGDLDDQGYYVNGYQQAGYEYEERKMESIIAFMADLKFNFLVKKRIQPVVMYSFGFATNYGPIGRMSYGIDFHSKTDKLVLTYVFNMIGENSSSGLKLTIKR